MIIFWFRRDLRLEDNAALYYALKNHQDVQPLFIFDTEILDKLANKKDARISFIYQEIERLQKQLSTLDCNFLVRYGKPMEVLQKLINDFAIEAVYTNHDYEPYAIARDKELDSLLNSKNIHFKTYKDQCIFEKNEVIKDDGKPYTVFTPYSRKWKSNLTDYHLKSYPTEKYFHNFRNSKIEKMISLDELGFSKSDISFPENEFNKEIIADYKEKRDFPAINGTSKLSLHLRFGTISIRTLTKVAKELSENYLNELIWRDFYMMILWHFPHIVKSAFKPAYNHIEWRNNPDEFEAWCNGQTGYPIVDAGMRELNNTGFMHNRVRMIVASFLTKHLLIDWRWGEAYFAEKLLDYELSSNNGGWQWAASSGCDAAPYFRVFNPELQTQRFDPKLKYVRKWVPEFEDFSIYPKPIVDHKFARERVLRVYKEALTP